MYKNNAASCSRLENSVSFNYDPRQVWHMLHSIRLGKW